MRHQRAAGQSASLGLLKLAKEDTIETIQYCYYIINKQKDHWYIQPALAHADALYGAVGPVGLFKKWQRQTARWSLCHTNHGMVHLAHWYKNQKLAAKCGQGGDNRKPSISQCPDTTQSAMAQMLEYCWPGNWQACPVPLAMHMTPCNKASAAVVWKRALESETTAEP